MKTKIALTIFAMFISIISSAASEKIHVAAVEGFSTKNPSKEINVKVLEETILGNYELKTDDIIHCNVTKIIKAKRGKRNASFEVRPKTITSNGEIIEIHEKYYGKYSSKILSKEELKNIDKKEVGKKAVLSVGNHFVKGVAPVASLAEGFIKNEDGNRIESGVKQLYKDSPLVYIEKGQELELTEEQPFYLIFKTDKNTESATPKEEIAEEGNEG